MDTPALKELLNTARLYPDERAELVFLIGRIARLEVIEADAIALVDALPKDLKKLTVQAGDDRASRSFYAGLVKISGRVRL